MIDGLGNMSRLAMVAVVGALFAACSGGPSDSEFVAACKNEGQGLGSQMLDAEMGVTRDAFCECGAGVARSSLSSDGYRAMILDMQGKKQEAQDITSRMSDSEQEAAMMVVGEMLQKCAGLPDDRERSLKGARSSQSPIRVRLRQRRRAVLTPCQRSLVPQTPEIQR